MKTSLMTLSASDRLRVWAAIDRGEIPYPVNGLVPTMLVEWVTRPSWSGESMPDGDTEPLKRVGVGSPPRACTCHKPFNSRVVKCDYCRAKIKVVFENCEPVDAATAEYMAAKNAAAKAATVEYRIWRCNKCQKINTPLMTGPDFPFQIGYEYRHSPHDDCGGFWTVIPCDSAGREVGGKRWFKPAWRDENIAFWKWDGFVGMWFHRDGSTEMSEFTLEDRLENWPDHEITEREAMALLK